MKADARQQAIQAEERTLSSRLGLPRPCLMLVTEPMERARLIATIRAAVSGGVDIVQIRDRTAQPKELNDIVSQLRLSMTQTLLVLNSVRPGEGADSGSGVHLPEEGPSLGQVRASLEAGALVGRSVHSVTAAQQAEREGADYLVAGTIFASASHPDITPAGLAFLEQICRAVSVPVIAIGGITPERVGGCLRVGAAGVAVLSAILHATDPFTAASQYRAALDAVRRNLP